MTLYSLSIVCLLSGAVIVADAEKPQLETRTLARRPKRAVARLHIEHPTYKNYQKPEYCEYVVGLINYFIESEAEFKEKNLADGMEYIPAANTGNLEDFKAIQSFFSPKLFSELLPQFTCIVRVDKIQEQKGFVTGTERCFSKINRKCSEI